MSVLSLLRRTEKLIEQMKNRSKGGYITYNLVSTLNKLVNKILNDIQKETGYAPIYPVMRVDGSYGIQSTLDTLEDVHAQLQALVEERNIVNLKEENVSLQNQVNDLKRGMGVYCELIGNKCNRLFEPKDQCFIIYDYESKEFENAICNPVRNAGLEPVISKHIKIGESTGMYCTTICEPIRSSKLCVADISKENTNVGLEVGLAWRYGKPVILTMDKTKKENLPSDLAAFTLVYYKDAKELERELTKKVEGFKKGVSGL